MKKLNNSTSGVPGLSSLGVTNTPNTTTSKNYKEPAPKKPTGTTPPKPVNTGLTRNTSASKTTSPQYTHSNFRVGGNRYDIIDDNSQARKMIMWDKEGNVDPNSPIQVVGKNASGGFVLAAKEETPDVSRAKFPFSQDQGIAFQSLESDAEGADSSMQNIHNKEFTDLSSVINPIAASQLRGIYRRTGQY